MGAAAHREGRSMQMPPHKLHPGGMWHCCHWEANPEQKLMALQLKFKTYEEQGWGRGENPTFHCSFIADEHS